MMDQAVHPASGLQNPPTSAEATAASLGADLARADGVARSVGPILRHLVAADDLSIFNDEILARIRAALSDVARGLVEVLVGKPVPEDEVEILARALIEDAALLAHVHALALEWQLTERLQARLALDPVMSPQVAALLADPATQVAAQGFLSAQARWCQAQRHMALPLRELPGPILSAIFGTVRAMIGEGSPLATRAAAAEAEILRSRDQEPPRYVLAAGLVFAEALDVEQAGAALFLSALAPAFGQDRDAAVLATHESQRARLALALRAAGTSPEAIERQFLLLHPELSLPGGLAEIDPTQAAAMLGKQT